MQRNKKIAKGIYAGTFAVISLLAMILLVTELCHGSPSKNTDEDQLLPVITATEIDLSQMEEYRFLSEISSLRGDAHLFFATSLAMKSLGGDDLFWMSGDIYEKESEQTFLGVSKVNVLGTDDEISFLAEESGPSFLTFSEETMTNAARGGFVVREGSGFTVSANVPLKELLSVTGISGFQFLFSGETCPLEGIPVLFYFDGNGSFLRLKTNGEAHVLLDDGKEGLFFLYVENKGRVETFPVISEKEEENEEDRDLYLGLLAQEDASFVPFEERILWPFYETYPDQAPKGSEFKAFFVDAPEADEATWNVAAYVAWEESLQSFEKWYLGDMWDVNGTVVKKACRLLLDLGLVTDPYEQIVQPEEELQ